MKKLVWTAVVLSLYSRNYLIAQEKSSKARLLKRLIADDPIWSMRPVEMVRMKMFPKNRFRRGLAIKSISAKELYNR